MSRFLAFALAACGVTNAASLQFGIYESKPVAGGKAVETFDLTQDHDSVKTWGSYSGLNEYTFDEESNTLKHLDVDVSAKVEGSTLKWSHGYVSTLIEAKIPQIEGLYNSYPVTGDASTEPVEQVSVTQSGSDHVTTWGSVSMRNDFSLDGNKLTLLGDSKITAEISPCGQAITFSHGYVLKKAWMTKWAEKGKDKIYGITPDKYQDHEHDHGHHHDHDKESKEQGADVEFDHTKFIWMAIGILALLMIGAFYLGHVVGDCCCSTKSSTYPGEAPKQKTVNSVVLLSVPVSEENNKLPYDESPPIPKASDLV
jgi:hypothetical protein